MKHRVITPSAPEWTVGLNRLGPEIPPERLYVVGRPIPPYEKSIAVVGSRRPTAAGVEAAETLTRGLAEAGFTIVSGLAMGIDAIAHRTALEVGAHTVAVLGCGLDVDYPARNSSLRKRIAEQGTLVTEYEPGTQPAAQNFPCRNRIIAGISAGVLFAEGSLKSGGRITSRHAFDAGRSVFAVPGSIRNPLGQGPNELIRTHQATLVTTVKHIFDDVVPGLVWPDRSEALDEGLHLEVDGPPLEEKERLILHFLDDAPITTDRLVTELNLPPGDVALHLSRLEVRGMVVRRPAGYEISTKGARARAATPAR